MERTPTERSAPQPPANDFDGYDRDFVKSRGVRSRSDGATVAHSIFLHVKKRTPRNWDEGGERGFRRRQEISAPQRGSYISLVYAMAEVFRGSWAADAMLITIAP